MLPAIHNFFLYAALFLLPWQTRWIIRPAEINGSFWEYGTISIFAIDVLIIMAGLTYVMSADKPAWLSWRNTPRLTALAFVLAVCLGINAAFSLLPAVSLFKLFTLALAAALAYLIAASGRPLAFLIKTFVAGTALSGLLGMWQFISQNAVAASWFGLAAHDPRQPGVSVVEAVAPDGVIERWLRAYGSLDHPNMLGGLMAIALIFGAWLLFNRRRENRRYHQEIALVLALTITSGALLFSFSRTAWLAAGIGLVWLTIQHLRKSWPRMSELIALWSIILVITALIFSQYSYLFFSRLQADGRLENKSVNERITGLKDSLVVIETRPFTGTGLSTYTLALTQTLSDRQPAWFYQPVHNTALLILAETGPFTFVWILVLGFGLIAIIISRTYPSRGLTTAVITSFIILGLFDHWLYSLHFGPLLLAAAYGFLAKRKVKESAETVPKISPQASVETTVETLTETFSETLPETLTESPESPIMNNQ